MKLVDLIQHSKLRLKNCALAYKFSELVANWRLVFRPKTKEKHDTTFVFKSFY